MSIIAFGIIINSEKFLNNSIIHRFNHYRLPRCQMRKGVI